MNAPRKTKAPHVVQTIPAIAMGIDWNAQHALVLGLGESGLAAMRWLARKGAQVTVLDTRPSPPMLAQAQELAAASGGRLKLHVNVPAPFASRWLSDVSMVIPSPGLTPHACHQSVIAEILAQAKEQGVDVFGEIDLFEWAIHHAAHASSAAHAHEDLELPLELPKVLAITGTNGKTTTTQMTVALLRRAGFDAQEAGNISPSLLDAVMAREDESRFPQAWVIELSSFQLSMARHFHPTAAALLNITEDHLDWHRDMDDYMAAKHRVFGIGIDAATSGVLCVANRQDVRVMQGTSGASRVTTFGVGAPPVCGDFGLADEGLMWMVMRDPLDEERVHRLMPADALRARGRHNAMNAMAALALCRAVTPALAPLLHGLREFRSGAHRMQWVAHVQGVDFVDDSKGTNVGATVAAIEGLGLPLVLIAGGEGKGQDFSPLAAPLAAHAKAVVVIGKDAPAIAAVARTAGIATAAAESMADAVREAFALAQPNAVVLMSPACASFDMFANYVDRARAFHEAVAALADAQGVTC
jgi:UDP-N-acetylmuramoylalanine--D-glutamate ligase